MKPLQFRALLGQDGTHYKPFLLLNEPFVDLVTPDRDDSAVRSSCNLGGTTRHLNPL